MPDRRLHLVPALLLAAALFTGAAVPGTAGAAEPASPPSPAAPADAPPAMVPEQPPFVDIAGRQSSHQKGKIHLTVYLDFFCHHCHDFDTILVPVLRKEYGDKLQIQYVGFPIVDPKASHIPVLAYYLADAQGKGDPMREMLFSAIWDSRLDVTRPEILLGIAQKAGLDLDAFKRGFNENSMGPRLNDGVQEARAIGVRGTPTLLVDNHIRLNDNSLKNIEAVFADVLKSGG